MRRPVKRLAAAAVAVLAVALLVFILRPAAVQVDVVPVARGRLRVTVDEEGYTRVRDRFVIAAPIAGRLARIALRAGDTVERGTVVARMRPLPLDPRARAEAMARLHAAEAASREAEARAEKARVALQQAQRTGTRARHLGKTGVIAVEERELAELEETARRKELEAATFAARAAAARAALLAPGAENGQALVAACEAQPETCLELRSPIRGEVLRVDEQSERTVAAGTPLLELGDPRALEVVVDVLSADAVQVKPGALVLIENWGGGQPLHARVRVVEPSGFTKVSALGVEEQRVNVIADFVDPAVPVADGYRVEARIVVWEGDDVLKVPSSALFRHDGAWAVFTMEAGRAHRRVINVGHRSAVEAQILDGLDEGSMVIRHPSDRIADRVRVAPL
ncbi:MAG: efflux RND transporter periplasmic adaptor subunit [Candidatus Binatia bacterium]